MDSALFIGNVMSDELLTKVESLKNILISRATGGISEEHEYTELRRELLFNVRIEEKLPRFVRTCRNLSEFWGFIKPKFSTYDERRTYLRKEFEPVLAMLESESRTPSDESVLEIVNRVSAAYIQEVWRKALERRATDPDGAITIARTLIESVCKHILDEEDVTYEDDADLPRLYSLVSRQLNLAPSQQTEKLFKQILGGCQTVVEGLGALRNRLSDAHGKGKEGVRPAPRHAELAVNLAGTMSTFLLVTWEARKTHE